MLSSIRLALVWGAISAAQVVGAFSFDCTLVENLANESVVETITLVIGLDQAASIYQLNTPPVTQRTKYELDHKRKYILVGVKNRSPTPLRGRMQVIGKWNGRVRAEIDVHYLPAEMNEFDYFIVPEYGIFASDRTSKPELQIEWVTLRVAKARQCGEEG